MKGKLSKFQDRWGVIYDIPNPPIATATVAWLPLHPEYTKYYFLDEDAEGGEVEWDWCVIVDHDSGKGKEYAKLVRSENKIDLQKLETKLVQSLSEETDWTLSKWLKKKREQTNGERFDEFMKPLMNNQNFEQFSLYEHKETITSADTITTSQAGVSDEEIEQAAFMYATKFFDWDRVRRESFIQGAEWFREQLKKK